MNNLHFTGKRLSLRLLQKGTTNSCRKASMCIECGSCVHACPETGSLELATRKAILAYPDRCAGIEAIPTIHVKDGQIASATRCGTVERFAGRSSPRLRIWAPVNAPLRHSITELTARAQVVFQNSSFSANWN